MRLARGASGARIAAAWLCGAVALTGVVDRIESGVVVLESRDGERCVPRAALPALLREGDVVLRGRVDAAASARRREKSRALLRRLRARALSPPAPAAPATVTSAAARAASRTSSSKGAPR